MDPTRALEQLWSNLSALPPRRLFALAVVGVSLFAAIALGNYMLSKSDYQAVYLGLSPQDASRIAGVLSELGIPFEVAVDGSKVSVPAELVGRARGSLAERGLPASASAGYELFDKIGPLGLTSFMQDVTRTRVLEGEIMRTLQSMKHVVSARVHLVMGEKASFRRGAQSPSASVVVKLATSSDKAPVDAIRHVVSAAVPDLKIESVRVVSADGTVLAGGGESLRSGANKMLELESSIVEQMKTSVGRTLAPIIGFENFETSISVRLNADQKTTNENIFDPESRVERSVRVIKEAGNSQDSSGDQAAGVDRNVPTSADAAQNGKNQKSNQRRDELTNYEISSKSVTTTRDSYSVENISIAVVVNQKRLVKPDGSPMDQKGVSDKLAEIEKIVAAAVGIDQQRGDRIIISAQEFQIEPVVDIDSGQSGLSVAIQNYSGSVINAVAFVLAVLAIVWFGLRPLSRILIESPGAAHVQPALPPGSPVLGEGFEIAKGLASDQFPSFGSGFATDIEVSASAQIIGRLNDLISRDPDQAAAVLRRWIKTDATSRTG